MGKKVKNKTNKVTFPQLTKQLRSATDNYKAAVVSFGKNLDKMQGGAEGEPVWNGTRAKRWMNRAVNYVYNLNARDVNDLEKALKVYESYCIYLKQHDK
jgi:hypothetical protein